MNKKTKNLTWKIHPTSNDAVSVRVSYSPADDDTIAMAAYAVGRRDGVRLTEYGGTFKKVAKSDQEIEVVEKILISKIMRKINQKGNKQIGRQPEVGIFTVALQDFTEAEQLSLLCSPDWSRSTFKNYLTYARKNIFPLLDKFGMDITHEEMASIVGEMIQKAVKNKRGYGSEAYSKQGTVQNHIIAFNFIYKKLSALSPRDLPDIRLPESLGGKMPQREQIKSIPEVVRVKFCELLIKNIHLEHTLGAVLMMTGMLRTSEACALYFKDIKIDPSGNFASYFVNKQIQNGEIVPFLKSKNAYRRIILPQFAVSCIQKRREHLLGLGFIDGEIDEMLVVSRENNHKKAINPGGLSHFVRKLLIKSGFTRRNWADAEKTMEEEPDVMEDGSQIKDLSAYVLRRMGCTLLVNGCGLNSALVDLLMGHKLPHHEKNRWSLYMRQPENFRIIAQKLERVIYHPDYSNNPKFRPVTLASDQPVASMVDHQEFVLIVDEGGFSGRLQIDARELGESIFIRVPKNSLQNIEASLGQRPERAVLPVIGVVREEETYRSWVKQVGEIDFELNSESGDWDA